MAKTDSERGERAAWIVRHRKRLYGNNLEQLAAALRAEGVRAEVPTIRGWEAGANPGPEAREAMERLFGEPMPAEREPLAVEDLAVLVEAQTRAVNDLVTELRIARAEAQGRDDLLAAAIGDLSRTLERFEPVPAAGTRPSTRG